MDSNNKIDSNKEKKNNPYASTKTDNFIIYGFFGALALAFVIWMIVDISGGSSNDGITGNPNDWDFDGDVDTDDAVKKLDWILENEE